MLKNHHHTAFKRLLWPFLLIMFYIVAGISVQYLPDEPAETHIKSSCEIFLKEDLYPFAGVDNYTDIAMLLISRAKPEEPGYRRFFSAPLYSVKQTSTDWVDLYPIETLCGKRPPIIINYARYWHGYQIILRPLLYFTDYQHIRHLNLAVQVSLFLFMLYLMWRRKVYGLIPAWILSYIVLTPHATGMNMTYSIAFYISTIASILILKQKENIEKKITFPIFFLMIGISMCFFDFFTYHIASLGLPLTVLFYMDPPKNTKDMLKKLITYSAFWLIGFVGMLFLKWTICALFIDTNIFADAMKSIHKRIYINDIRRIFPFHDLKFYSAIPFTLYMIIYQPENFYMKYCIAAISLLSIAPIAFNIKSCIFFIKNNYYKILPFLIIASGVPLYCLIIRAHPLQHSGFAYRIWIVFFFAIIAGLNFIWLEALKNKKK